MTKGKAKDGAARDHVVKREKIWYKIKIKIGGQHYS
jgi:hypothetical protein